MIFYHHRNHNIFFLPCPGLDIIIFIVIIAQIQSNLTFNAAPSGNKSSTCSEFDRTGNWKEFLVGDGRKFAKTSPFACFVFQTENWLDSWKSTKNLQEK